jgi:hypothetical protein
MIIVQFQPDGEYPRYPFLLVVSDVFLLNYGTSMHASLHGSRSLLSLCGLLPS